MNTAIFLLAQRGADSPGNKWLGENPIVLGAIFLAIGGALAVSGAYALRKGVTQDKYGNEYRGGEGRFIAIVRLVGGVSACAFAIYKLVAG